MLTKTGIPYLDYVWNITKGCSKLSSGCSSCWAEKMSKRMAGNNIRGYEKGSSFKPYFDMVKMDDPYKRKKPAVIGVSFMGDLFHDEIPSIAIEDVFNEMIKANWHNYVVLTKRPKRLYNFLNSLIGNETNLLSHIWFGVSVEDNKTLIERGELMWNIKDKYPNLKLWLSLEPLLEDVSLNVKMNSVVLQTYDCIIVGGESGPGARYCDPHWIFKIHDLCCNNDNEFYFKQWGTNKNNLLDPNSGMKYRNINFINYRNTYGMATIKQCKELPWREII